MQRRSAALSHSHHIASSCFIGVRAYNSSCLAIPSCSTSISPSCYGGSATRILFFWCEITGGVLSSADVYNRTDLSSNQQRMSAEVADALVKVRFPYLQMKHEDLRTSVSRCGSLVWPSLSMWPNGEFSGLATGKWLLGGV